MTARKSALQKRKIPGEVFSCSTMQQWLLTSYTLTSSGLLRLASFIISSSGSCKVHQPRVVFQHLEMIENETAVNFKRLGTQMKHLNIDRPGLALIFNQVMLNILDLKILEFLLKHSTWAQWRLRYLHWGPLHRPGRGWLGRFSQLWWMVQRCLSWQLAWFDQNNFWYLPWQASLSG